MEKEKEKKVSSEADTCLLISVPGSDEEAYEVIGAFKKVFNEKTKWAESVRIGKIDSCLHMNGEAAPTAPMYGAAHFIELYDINDIGCMFGEMRGNAEVQEAIETLEKYTFSLFLAGLLVNHSPCVYGAVHAAGMPIEAIITVRPLKMIVPVC